MAKSKAKKYQMGRKEFIFNIISIIVLIGICLYFGSRSLYYYSKQNMKLAQEQATLASSVLKNNKVTNNKNGLHKTKDGYIFKGNVESNYVFFAGRLFRIMEVYNDNSVKLVSEDNQAVFLWGDDPEYKTSNIYHWLNKTEKEISGTYYDSIPNPDALLTNVSWCDAILNKDKVKCDKTTESSLFSILSVEDYVNTGGKNSYLKNSQYHFLLGHDQENSNLIVDEEGDVTSVSNYEGYGIRVVLQLKKNIEIVGGTGSEDDPYFINQGENQNIVNQSVKLGDHQYVVYSDKDDILKLSMNDYIPEGTGQFVSMFSNKNATFDPTYKYNIANYLNTTFYQSLPYKDLLLDCPQLIGEISNETGLSIEHSYGNIIHTKVGLLNIFDINTNKNVSDYYLINNTSSIGMMGYVFNSKGILNEDKVTEKKHVVPTICINKNLIKSGTGKKDDPYRVE